MRFSCKNAGYICCMNSGIRLVVVFSILCRAAIAQPYYAINASGQHEGGITVLTKDYGNKYLIAGDEKGYLYFHNLSDGGLVKKIQAHGAAVNQLRFNSTGRLLISATQDGEIKIFDFEKDKIIQSIYSPSYSGINFVLFSIADGFVYFNGNNKLYKTRSDLSQSVNEVLAEEDTILDAIITNDRSALIYSTGSLLKVLNTRTDFVVQEFRAASDKIGELAFVNDSTLATWSFDGKIQYWNYRLGQVEPQPLFFFKAGLPAPMSFSDSGRLMCSGRIGNWARVWEPKERKIIQELFSHSAMVTSTCFGTDESTIYTGSIDKSIMRWSTNQPDTTVAPVVAEVPPPVVEKPAPPETLKDFEMADNNIPAYIQGRKVISTVQIEMQSPEVTVFVFDNSYLDGDTMSLFFNGKWILDHYGVTKKKTPVYLSLVPNTNNYLVLFANNLGKSPPNTAAIEFNDGKSRRFYRLSSDLNTCNAINFFYKQ